MSKLLRADPPERSRKPVTVRAIHSNEGVRVWYMAQLEYFIQRMRHDIERAVLSVYGELAPPELAHDANPSILLRNALRKWGGLWVSRFDKLSLDLGSSFARKNFNVTQAAMKAAFREAGFTVKFTPTPASISAYHAVAAEQVNLIKSIPQQYLKDVQTNVWQSVMKGGDMHTLSTALQKTYGVTRERAAVISRDQNNRAKATIERARRQELGIVHAIWQHSAGGVTPRKTHVAMNGKAYIVDQGMWDSDAGQYVLPGELINCRCTSKAVIPAFDTVESAEARAAARTPGRLMAGAAARAR